MDDLWYLDFFTDRDGQARIAVLAGDVLIFALYAGQLDQAYQMVTWRNHALTASWLAQRAA